MNKKQTTNKTDKYTHSNVYKLSCPDCSKAYVRQTGRSFLTRFNEHKAAFKTSNQSSNYAKHLTEYTHSFGPIQDTMQILQCQNQGAHLNTIERYYIYREFTQNNHLNDDVVLETDPTPIVYIYTTGMAQFKILICILDLFVYITKLHECTNLCLLCSDVANCFLVQ